MVELYHRARFGKETLAGGGTRSVEGEPLIADPPRWRLPPGSPGAGFGADVDRVARRAPAEQK